MNTYSKIMPKIVVTQNLELNNAEKARLEKLGEVVYYNDLPQTPEEWLKRSQAADIICTGRYGLTSEKVYELENKYIAIPFVGTGFLDLERLKARKIVASRTPGCNKEAVSEWVTAMILNLFRNFPKYINRLDLPTGVTPEPDKGLKGRNITILGNGNVGSRVGAIAAALEMNVKYFLKGDNLPESINEADVVVDALALNPETTGLLNRAFFQAFKPGAYFITVTGAKIYDTEAMLEALDAGILAGVAIDCGSIQVGNDTDPIYLQMAKHPKVLATPHIAYNSDVTDRQANQMMIDNIEAYLNGQPTNLLY